MMRLVFSLVAVGIIALGLWLIAASFTETAPPSARPAQVVTAPPQTASPIILGTALLAGGVVFLVLIFRRR
jgi:hypothetical protein